MEVFFVIRLYLDIQKILAKYKFWPPEGVVTVS